MPVIIVATDHSAIGDNAVNYAAGLAARWNCSLVLVHAYFIPITFNDPAMPIIPPDDLMDAAKERMDDTVGRLRTAFPQMEISGSVSYGDIQDVLEDAVDELQPLLVIAGSHGGDEDTNMWMGDTTLDLLRNIKCPVLAVPPAVIFKPVRQICLALDFSAPEEYLPVNTLDNLLQLCDGGTMHLLHVAKEEGEAAVFSYEGTPSARALQVLNPTFHQAATTGSVDEKIAEFCESNNMDWMAVIPHHHSFWQSLFYKSHTKGVVRVSHIPVLALHEEHT